jgi:hypothetical protein
VERPDGCVRADHRFVAEAVDHRAGDLAVDRREQPEADAAGSRSQDRQPQQPSAEPSLPRVLTKNLGVAHPVLPADLEDAVALVIERCDEILDDVLDRDRLSGGLDPAGRHHEREGLD